MLHVYLEVSKQLDSIKKHTFCQLQEWLVSTSFTYNTPIFHSNNNYIPRRSIILERETPPLMEKEQELSNGHRYDIIDPEESRVYGMLCLERYTSTMSLNCWEFSILELTWIKSALNQQDTDILPKSVSICSSSLSMFITIDRFALYKAW